MTHQKDNTTIGQVLEELIENGTDGLEAAVSILINEAMKVERSRVLDAEPRQRNDRRRGYPTQMIQIAAFSRHTLIPAMAEPYIPMPLSNFCLYFWHDYSILDSLFMSRLRISPS